MPDGTPTYRLVHTGFDEVTGDKPSGFGFEPCIALQKGSFSCPVKKALDRLSPSDVNAVTQDEIETAITGLSLKIIGSNSIRLSSSGKPVSGGIVVVCDLPRDKIELATDSSIRNLSIDRRGGLIFEGI